MSFDKRTFTDPDKQKEQERRGNQQGNGDNSRSENQQKSRHPNVDEVLRQEYSLFADVSSLEKFLNSPFVLVGFASACFAIVTGFHFLREDMFTTRTGWDSLPLNMAYNDTGWWIAVALTVAPTFFYTMALVTGNRWFKWLSVGCMLFDGALDMVFRMHTPMQANFGAWLNEFILALVVSFGVFTVMSEIAFTGGLPMAIFLFPYAIQQVMMIMARLIAGVYAVDKWFFDWSNKNK